MRTTLVIAAAVAVISGTARSQATIVSPLIAATTEGTGNNIYPFCSPVVRRYQQIHGDLGAGVKLIRSMTFRLNATTSNYTAAWTIDLEAYMGINQGVAGSTQFFDRNYSVPRTAVVARKVINWGPGGQGVSPGPNPFNAALAVTLDAPFLYLGTPFALVWEVVVYSNTVSTSFAMDADSGTAVIASPTITGTGCTATGRTTPMTHLSTLADMGGLLGWSFTVTAGPSSAPTYLALGTTNPNVTLPGLCSPVLTDMAAVLPIGTTDAAGAITTHMSGATTFVLKNTFPGAIVFSQVHALDAGQPGLPFANSNGRQTVVPFSNPQRVCDIMRVFNDLGGTTAIEGNYFQTLSVGYGLVTQFAY